MCELWCVAVAVYKSYGLWELRCEGVAEWANRGVGKLSCVAVMVFGSCIIEQSQRKGVTVVTKP